MIKCICGRECQNELAYLTHISRCLKVQKLGIEKIRTEYFENKTGISYDIFYNEYIINQNGLRYLERKFGLQIFILKRLANYYNIDLRKPSDAIRIQNEKNKKYFYEKYGVENPFQIPDVINIIQTKRNNNKEELYRQLKKNNLEKYGVENVFQLEEVKEKSKQTKLEKYGDENYSNRELSKETIKEKYGSHSNLFQQIIIPKLQEKYGVDNVFQLEEVKEKSKQTLIEKYGVSNISKIEEIISNKRKYFYKKYGVINPLLLKQNRPKNRKNKLQIKIENILKDLKIKFEPEFKIGNYFVDIYIPENKIVLEINGDFWHANPLKYLPEDIVMIPGTNGKGVMVIDLWKKDLKKMNYVKNDERCEEYIILWEYDINNRFEEIRRILCQKLLKLKV